jgi:hypothetical protein
MYQNMCKEKNKMYGGYGGTITINASVSFVSESYVMQSSTIIAGDVMTEELSPCW